jgi:undecaprenyl-diphosphatase
MSYLQAIILAIIEGLTEFLPISSTGHMVIASSLMGIEQDEFVKMFTIAIQFGAILSVLALYWKRFFKSVDFYFKLFVAFLPAAVLGFFLADQIDRFLESPITVAVTLILGGIILLFVDDWFRHGGKHDADVSYGEAFRIGLFQCIAMVPGVSRSGATIIGGLAQKLTKKAAAEFSFFLAVPTMLAATAYKMYKYHTTTGFQPDDAGMLLLGNVIAFIVAMLAIKGFITYVTRSGFKIFGIYRIVVGVIILILFALGYNPEML